MADDMISVLAKQSEELVRQAATIERLREELAEKDAEITNLRAEVERLKEIEDCLRDDLTIARDEISRLTAAINQIIAECDAAIASQPLPPGYATHDDVPNGLRPVSHIKLSMIRGYACAALQEPPRHD